jgi:hypothetical protein
MQLMTWAGSSVTVHFTGSDEVAVELDGRLTAVPAADRWVNLTRNDLPFVVLQASGVPAAVVLAFAWNSSFAFAVPAACHSSVAERYTGCRLSG